MPKLPEDLFTGEIGRGALPVLERVKKGEISGDEAVDAVLEAMKGRARAAVDTVWHAEGKVVAEKAKTPKS